MTVVLDELGRDPEAPALVLFGSRGRGEARPSSDLDLLLIVAAALTPERGQALRSRASEGFAHVRSACRPSARRPSGRQARLAFRV